jgi:hypothetical protein
VKSPAGIELFKNNASDTPLPPTPVITQWGSCSVVNEFNGDNASSITTLQDIFQDSNELKVLRTDLAYIRANFSFLSQSITKLEMTTNVLLGTIKEINDILDKLKNQWLES